MSTCFLSVVITMSEQVVPSAVKILTKVNVKPTEILVRRL
jgi:hypothetical protein